MGNEIEQAFINELVADLWLHGRLQYRLKAHQRVLYNNVTQSQGLKYIINCCRRFGKSFILSLIAIEFALSHNDSHIRFAAPSQKQLTEIIQPIFGVITKDAPEKAKPVWNSKYSYYHIPLTDSYIHAAGCNEGGMENLRGHLSNLNIVDEAGSIINLEYLIKDILLPQTLTTGGRTLIASTPPKTPDHYFKTLCDEAYLNNSYTKFTIDDNTSLSSDLVELYAKESGGRESTTWKREYLCEFVVDENLVIIPEWNRSYIVERERDEYYQFYQVYESMDIGGRDKTVILYGYYDFKRAKLVIEHESVFSGQRTTTKSISEAIKYIESEHYDKKLIHRYADNNNVIMLQDLSIQFNISFEPTDKTYLRGDDIFDGSMVNETRLFIGAGKLEVNPRCRELIGNLDSGIWTANRKQFERSEVYGHYDALAALIYLIRNVDTQTNPIPGWYGKENIHMYHGLERLNSNSKENNYRKVFI